jgi:hypothetical protein
VLSATLRRERGQGTVLAPSSPPQCHHEKATADDIGQGKAIRAAPPPMHALEGSALDLPVASCHGLCSAVHYEGPEDGFAGQCLVVFVVVVWGTGLHTIRMSLLFPATSERPVPRPGASTEVFRADGHMHEILESGDSASWVCRPVAGADRGRLGLAGDCPCWPAGYACTVDVYQMWYCWNPVRAGWVS